MARGVSDGEVRQAVAGQVPESEETRALRRRYRDASDSAHAVAALLLAADGPLSRAILAAEDVPYQALHEDLRAADAAIARAVPLARRIGSALAEVADRIT